MCQWERLLIHWIGYSYFEVTFPIWKDMLNKIQFACCFAIEKNEEPRILETLNLFREVFFTGPFPVNICRTAVKSAPKW